MANNLDLEILLKGNTTQFVNSFQKAQEEFKKATEAIKASAQRTKTDLDNAFGALKVRGSSEILAEANQVKSAFDLIRNSANASATDVNRAADSMRAKFQELGSELKGSTPNIDSFGRGLGGLVVQIGATLTALAGIGAAIRGVKEVFDAGITYEKTINTLTVATGSAEKANEAFSFLKDTANSLGLSVNEIAPAFSKFAAASKGTALEGSKTQQVFAGVSKAVAALKLSGDEANGIFLALGQMMSKGKVQAEELRGQLGERLPGAFNLFAKSMGVSTAELDKMLQAGEVVAAETLPKFAQELENAFGGSAAQNLNTVTGKFALLQNQINELFVSIAQSGAMDALKEAIDGVSTRLKELSASGELKQMAQNISTAIATVIKVLASLGEFVAKNAKEIAALAGAFAAFKTISFAKGLVDDFNKVYAAATLANGGVTSLSKSLGLLAAAFGVGFAIGTFINDNFIVPFQKAREKADELNNATNRINQALNSVKPVDTSKVFADIDSSLREKIQNISRDYTQASSKLIEADKQAADAFDRAMSARVTNAQSANQQLVQQEQALNAKLKELAQQKSALEVQGRAGSDSATQQRIQREIAANQQKNTTLLDAEKKLEADKAALQALSSQNLSKQALKAAQEGARARIQADQAALNEMKRNAEQANASYKIAEDQRTAAHKSATDKIANQEAALKAQLEQIKQQRMQADKQLLDEANALYAQRAEQQKQLEFSISENYKSQIRARIDAENAATQQKIAAQKRASEQYIQNVIDTGNRQLQQVRAAYDKELEEGRRLFEGQAAYHERIKQSHDDVYRAAQAFSNRIIQVKQSEADKIRELITAELTAYQGYIDKIKGLQEEINSKNRSYADEEFQLRLRNMTQAEKAAAYEQQVAKGKQELLALTQKQAEQNGVLTEEQTKQFKEIESSTKEAIRAYASLGQNGTDSVLSVNEATEKSVTMMRELKDITVGSLENQKSGFEALKANAESANGSLEKLKQRATELAVELDKLTSLKKEITLQSNVDEIQSKVQQLAQMAEQGTSFTVRPETSAAQAAINQLRQPTSSTHTIYVRKVQTNADGGYIQKFADGGFARAIGHITGAGSETSDSIPSLLSNGEYVIRAAMVKKWGVSFFNALNGGYLPSTKFGLPAFAMGGLVGSGSTTRSDTVNLNISVGGNTFKMQSAREQAMGLAAALQTLSRAA